MKVAVVIGSDSDFEVMKKCLETLAKFKVEFEISVISAHRTPEKLREYLREVEKNNTEVIIAAAGKAAHLPGVIAAQTNVPVIGVPMKSSTLDGMDSLLSIVQMPSGIPVAAVAINGSENAALLAVEMLSLKYGCLKEELKKHRETMRIHIEEKDRKIKEEARALWKS